MAQRGYMSENASALPAGEHNGPGLAVPDERWYIAECKPTRERTLREMLRKVGYHAYVISQREERHYPSGNYRTVEHVLLPGRVFVHTGLSQLMPIMTTFSSVYRFQLNRTAAPDRFGSKPFAYVPQDDMERLQHMLDRADRPVTLTAADLRLDQEVRITGGPLRGLTGWYYRHGAASCIVIKVALGTNHYAFTEVQLDDIQPLA